MRTRLSTALLLSLLLSSTVSADDVYLKNGRAFKGVVAETSDSQVQIHLPGGVLSLPSNTVLRVEKSDSSFAEYLRRSEALKQGGRAADWLELARWSKTQGLAQGYREATVTAADLEPRLEGLAPHMRGFGYVFAADLDRWIPYEDSMRRKGLVQSEGQWVTREELAQKAKEREDEARDRRTARLTQDAREAELSLAELRLAKEAMRATSPVVASDPTYSLPIYGGFYFPPLLALPPSRPAGKPPLRHGGSSEGDRTPDGSLRQPGSLFPVGRNR